MDMNFTHHYEGDYEPVAGQVAMRSLFRPAMFVIADNRESLYKQDYLFANLCEKNASNAFERALAEHAAETGAFRFVLAGYVVHAVQILREARNKRQEAFARYVRVLQASQKETAV